MVSHDFRLISQVAEQLWEVKDKKIRDLSKEDVDMYVSIPPPLEDEADLGSQHQVQEHANLQLARSDREGQAHVVRPLLPWSRLLTRTSKRGGKVAAA